MEAQEADDESHLALYKVFLLAYSHLALYKVAIISYSVSQKCFVEFSFGQYVSIIYSHQRNKIVDYNVLVTLSRFFPTTRFIVSH